jgi:hypothetical protein
VRTQYHFRPGAQGLRAWSVHRLIAISSSITPTLVPLAAIRELDEAYWFSSTNAEPTCRAVVEHSRLINEADLSFPIILSSDGRVMDGMHRIAKAVLLGQSHVLAVRFTQDPEPDHVGVQSDELLY